MKSERRHELQHNELADQLGVLIERVMPYTKAILGGLLAVIVLGLAYMGWTQQQTAKQGKGWNELFNVVAFNDPMRRDEDEMGAELEKVAQRNHGTPPGMWALLTEANLDLESGARSLFTNREDGVMHLERARKNFEVVEKETARAPFLQQQARFGLGQAAESLGDVSKAKEKYDSAARMSPETALGKAAAARSKMLSEDENKNFVDWFQRQKPKAVNPHAGLPGMGGPGGAGTGKVPPITLDDLPQAPNINFPSSPGGDATKKPESDKPDGEKTEKKADEEKDEAKKPEAAPSDKPADKPADAPAKDEVKKEAATPEKSATPPADAKKDDAAPAKP